MLRRTTLLVGLAALATVTFLVLPTRPAGACSSASATDAQAFQDADAVFTGRLVDRTDPDMTETWSSADFSSLRFEVDDVYKGDVAADQVIVTEVSGASCGLEIEGTGPFLVYATTSHWEQEVPDDSLYAGLCNGTRTLDEVPASFGAPSRPSGASESDPSGQPPGPGAATGATDTAGRADTTGNPASSSDDRAAWVLIGALALTAAVVAVASVAVLRNRRHPAGA